MTMKSLLVVSAALLVSCGPNAAPATTETDPAASAEAAADLVPTFPGSTSVEVPNLGAPGTDSRSGNTIAMETDATPGEVATFYRDHFKQADIPIRADTANEQGGLISVARDGAPGAMISISRIGDKTRITVTSRG